MRRRLLPCLLVVAAWLLAGGVPHALGSTAPSVFPSSGPTTDVTRVTIHGTGFTTGSTVEVGGVPATDVTVWTTTRIDATAAPHVAGLVDVVVTTPGGPPLVLPGAFEYVDHGCRFTVPSLATVPAAGHEYFNVSATPAASNLPDCMPEWRSGSPWLALRPGYEHSRSAYFLASRNRGLARTGYVAIGETTVAIHQDGVATADTDGDGLDDDWETQFGLSPTSAAGEDGALGDPDGDGLSNLEEYFRASHPRGTTRRYFAEGSSGDLPDATFMYVYPFLETRFALFNPGDAPAHVLMRFMRSDLAIITLPFVLAPHARRTVDARGVPDLLAFYIVAVGVHGYRADFSTTIESDQLVVADRTMTWSQRNPYGGHMETAVDAPSPIWYLAEGSTLGGFQLYYLLQNPNETPTTVRVTYLRPVGAPLEKTYALPALSRTTIQPGSAEFDGLGRALASTDVSAVIESLDGSPIVVERAMYLPAFGGGHESAGVRAPATAWFLAEGATGPFFDLFVLIANPTPDDAQVEATFLLPDGTTVVKAYVVQANARRTLWVDTLDARLADTAVSTTVRSTNDVPIIVERAMWWPDSAWREGHDSPGATVTGTRWAMAEGEVAGGRNTDTYILIANTSDREATVRVRLYFEDVTPATERVFEVRPHSRFNVDVRTQFPAARGRVFSATVESEGDAPADIVVERAMYWDASGTWWAAGTNALAVRLR